MRKVIEKLQDADLGPLMPSGPVAHTAPARETEKHGLKLVPRREREREAGRDQVWIGMAHWSNIQLLDLLGSPGNDHWHHRHHRATRLGIELCLKQNSAKQPHTTHVQYLLNICSIFVQPCLTVILSARKHIWSIWCAGFVSNGAKAPYGARRFL